MYTTDLIYTYHVTLVAEDGEYVQSDFHSEDQAFKEAEKLNKELEDDDGSRAYIVTRTRKFI